LNGKDLAMDNCKYTVSSGTADLATFSAGCKLNSTAMSNAPVKPMDNAVENTGNETKDANPSPKSSNIHPDDRTGVSSQPDMSNSGRTIMGTDQTANQNNSMKQDNDMKSADKNTASFTITGFVNGNSINGSIVVY